MKDKFRVEPSKYPNMRRVLREYGSGTNRGDQKQCWILDLPEMEHLFRTLGRHMSPSIKKEVAED